VDDWFDELAGFLRIASVSADPEQRESVREAGEWVCDFIRAAGGEAELIDHAGQPLAVGELRASRAPGDAPTVLCYGHFDVQPADPLELWDSAPFAPEIRGEYLYGRGVADDKGQLYLMLVAARELAAAGTLPVNVRFVCDGEEETGGQSILGYLAEDARGADAAVIFDSGMIARGRPAFNLATRGLLYFHLVLQTGERDLHSGSYGGAALNAIHALTDVLSAVRAVDGRLPEPLRHGIRPPTEVELADWAALPDGAHELSAAGAQPMDPAAAREFYRRTFAEPALDVNGILGGSPTLEKTVLPVRAEANVSIRLAPGQPVAAIEAAFRELLAAAAPDGAELQVELMSSALPGVVDPDSRAIQLAAHAFERALGVRPALIRSGGTLPIVATLTELGIPAVITGFSLPDSQIHSPNERLLVEYVELGIAAARALFEEFAAL
jgi:acetylornithine deacetylase/succinyl-diaminopimelate desuccinylase-like protein